MTAAQIAKIEAKRAAKAAKAAAKGAAKKEKKKAAGLGVGCAELRQRISPAGMPLPELKEMSRKIDPFSTGDVSVLSRPPVASGVCFSFSHLKLRLLMTSRKKVGRL